MEELIKNINTKKRFDKFITLLVNCVKSNSPISNNPVLDGCIIGFILNKQIFVQDIFLQKDMGRVLDGTIQQLEQVVIWLDNNSEELIKKYHEVK